MNATRCPICDTDEQDREVYASNFEPADLTHEVFSARRTPDRLHYRMVRCGGCNLLRSNPILSAPELARLYEGSRFTYAAEAEYTRRTYARYLHRLAAMLPDRGALMEIGCGNGFFLEEALAEGFREVAGIEPSAEAAGRASERVRPTIKLGLYGRATFPATSFDAICAFQVFDHVPDPGAVLAACHEHLRPGGLALFINHDCGALLNRVLGEASPIIDVEHTALFDKKTMRRIFEKHGFVVREVFSVWNTYPLGYWARLAPLPGPLKRAAAAVLAGSGLGKIPVKINAGNLGIIAGKAGA